MADDDVWNQVHPVVADEIARLRDVCRRQQDEVERLHGLLDAIDALHNTDEYENWCRHCEQMWPCPTNLLLHPEEARRG